MLRYSASQARHLQSKDRRSHPSCWALEAYSLWSVCATCLLGIGHGKKIACGTWHILAPWSIDWWILIEGDIYRKPCFLLPSTASIEHRGGHDEPSRPLSTGQSPNSAFQILGWHKLSMVPRHVNNNSRKGHSRVLLINKWHFLGYTWIHYRNGWHQLLVLDLIPLWKWDWVWRADASRHSFRMLSWLWCYPRSQSGYDEHAACQAISPGWPICTHHDGFFWRKHVIFLTGGRTKLIGRCFRSIGAA